MTRWPTVHSAPHGAIVKVMEFQNGLLRDFGVEIKDEVEARNLKLLRSSFPTAARIRPRS